MQNLSQKKKQRSNLALTYMLVLFYCLIYCPKTLNYGRHLYNCK
nr:MAG TPA: hypothetical protein [Caudoviricetes sp.]